MSIENLVQFMQEVDNDYWAAPDQETQIRQAVELGTHLGYQFTGLEVEEYLRTREMGEQKYQLLSGVC